MDAKTKNLVLKWLKDYRGDVEATARWMRDGLRIGGLKECRKLVLEALS